MSPGSTLWRGPVSIDPGPENFANQMASEKKMFVIRCAWKFVVPAAARCA